MSDFHYQEQYPLAGDKTKYKKISSDHVKLETIAGREILQVEDEGIRLLTEAAFHDVMHFLRPAHLKQVAKILSDKEASDNVKEAYVFCKLSKKD